MPLTIAFYCLLYKRGHLLPLWCNTKRMRQELLKELTNTKDELLKVLSSFNDNQFDTVSFEGSWTAGQVMQHILLSASSVKVLRGPVKKSNREPDEHVAKLQSIFLDFSTKFKSPEFIVPENKHYDLKELQASFENITAELKEIIQTADLSEICLNAPPILGELTRLELIRFISFHTQRHTQQLKNIKRILDNTKGNQP